MLRELKNIETKESDKLFQETKHLKVQVLPVVARTPLTDNGRSSLRQVAPREV